MSTQWAIDRKIIEIYQKDHRYNQQAYGMLFEVLDFAVAKLQRRAGTKDVRHVTGQQFVESAKEYGEQKFGPLAPDVFDSCGLFGCEDLANATFNMFDKGLLTNSGRDKKDDFGQGELFLRSERGQLLERCVKQAADSMGNTKGMA